MFGELLKVILGYTACLISGRIRISDGLAVCVISLRHFFASWRILKRTNELFDQLF